MSKEEKELLLKDLCTRLPYGVICHGVTKDRDEDGNYIDKEVTGTLYELHSYKRCYGLVGLMNECDIESIKPYLRPMYSMTQEERDELYTAMDWYGEIDETGNVYTKGQEKVYRETFYEYTDWLISHHFDFRGLIPIGLALEAPNDMYKEK